MRRMEIDRHIAAGALALALAVVGGCKSSVEMTSETQPTPHGDDSFADADAELYWYQRGSDATKAIWTHCRFREDCALLADGQGRPLGFFPGVQAFDLLLDSVGVFWRRDHAIDAVAAYYRDFTLLHLDRTARARNDEALWWAVACTRAARVTGDRRYLVEAQTIYDHLWLTQVDNANDGGMWDSAGDGRTKSARCNFPAVIAALNIYSQTKDLKYLLQARRLYKWATERFFDSETGVAGDGGRLDAGAFIGASFRLFRATGTRAYLANAQRAADALLEATESDGVLLPPTDREGDSLAHSGVCVRYLAELARRPSGVKYREFLQANARTAWTSRRLADGLNGPDWTKTPSDADKVDPQAAVSAAMLYFSTSRAFR